MYFHKLALDLKLIHSTNSLQAPRKLLHINTLCSLNTYRKLWIENSTKFCPLFQLCRIVFLFLFLLSLSLSLLSPIVHAIILIGHDFVFILQKVSVEIISSQFRGRFTKLFCLKVESCHIYTAYEGVKRQLNR